MMVEAGVFTNRVKCRLHVACSAPTIAVIPVPVCVQSVSYSVTP